MDLKRIIDVMFPPMISKLLKVVILLLATCSNIVVSADERCGSNKYWSSSTAQCEDCGSICVEINNQCINKCPDYPPSHPAEVTDNNSPAMPTYLLPVIVAAAATLVVILIVGAIVCWKRRAVIRSYLRRRSIKLKLVKVVPPTDGDSHETAKLQIGQHLKNPLIQTAN